jgi:Leucine-rich repeat (LRR) protein
MIEILNKMSAINSDEISNSNYSFGKDNSISLTGLKLKEIPSDIPPNIKSLIIQDNRFTDFPEGLAMMTQLQYLDLSQNRIRNISESISNLKNLHYLDLSNNKIKLLPNSISQLQNLRELNLESNKLKNINFNLCALKNLQILNLKNNKLNFQEVLKLVKCLPNTNIIFDKYELIEEGQAVEGEEE